MLKNFVDWSSGTSLFVCEYGRHWVLSVIPPFRKGELFTVLLVLSYSYFSRLAFEEYATSYTRDTTLHIWIAIEREQELALSMWEYLLRRNKSLHTAYKNN